MIGSPQSDNVYSNSGSAYVFERDGGIWTEVAKLKVNDADDNDFFGFSVNISGDRVVIGSPQSDEVYSTSGSAYVFERDEVGVWTEVGKLTASDAASEDFFGISVSMSGDLITVGAWADDDAGVFSGSAYVFGLVTQQHNNGQKTSDFNNNGIVDFPDFLLFAGVFGLSSNETGYDARFDLDGSEAIDFGDFLVFARAFGQ